MIPTGPAVLFCCDVGPDLGVGHLMRSLALAEELLGRGHRVVFAADAASVPWAREQLRVRGIDLVAPPATPQAYAALVTRVGARLVVVDSYRLDREVRRALRAAVAVLVAIVDGPVEDVGADVEVDQNLSAAPVPDVSPADGPLRLHGPAYALLRDDVRRARVAEDDRPHRAVPRVLAFLGGTDPHGATPLLVGRLARTGLPFDLTVVAPDAASERAVAAVPTATGQSVEVLAPTSRLPRLAAAADLVLSASGTSLLELLHLGVAAAVVQVADNQAPGYRALTSAGVVVGLGTVADLAASPASTAQLAALLTDGSARARLRSAGSGLVDGRGRERVADHALAVAKAGSRA